MNNEIKQKGLFDERNVDRMHIFVLTRTQTLVGYQYDQYKTFLSIYRIFCNLST